MKPVELKNNRFFVFVDTVSRLCYTDARDKDLGFGTARSRAVEPHLPRHLLHRDGHAAVRANGFYDHHAIEFDAEQRTHNRSLRYSLQLC